MSSIRPTICIPTALGTLLLQAATVGASGPGRNAASAPPPALPTTSQSDRAAALPEIVMLGHLATLYEPVPFDHKTHVRMAEMSGGCVLCHHHTPEGRPHASCRSCHPQESVRDNVELPGLKGAYHRQCLNCHQEWSHATACSACHVPRSRGAECPGIGTPQEVSEAVARMGVPARQKATYVYHTAFSAARVVTFHHNDHFERFGAQCSDCHRGDSCSRCHDSARSMPAGSTRHVAVTMDGSCLGCHGGARCSTCHDEAERPRFDHAMRTGWSLEAHHANLECCQCHGDVREFTTPTRSCHACHAQQRRLHAQGPPSSTTSVAAPSDFDCLACHTELRDRFAHAASIHGPASDQHRCTSCHDLRSESSPRPAQVRQQELCLRCHDRPVDGPNGRTVGNIAAILESCPNQHGPVRDGRCTACHDPHTSTHANLLARDYPSGLYASYASERYALCFRCHEENKLLGTAPVVTTGFRDGGTNLHKVHVWRDKGRTCSTCHDAHASSRPFRIREQVPFGESKWPLKINHELTPDGGRCGPGCHTQKSYARARDGRTTPEIQVLSGVQFE